MRSRLDNAQRTAHTRPSAQQGESSGSGRPWAEETEAYETAPSRGAEWADRAERGAWAGRQFKSAYAHLLNIPDLILPGDVATANQVKVQIEVVMDRGGYTTNEWNRLHKMLTVWECRARGEDTGFMLRGWSKKGDGRHTPGFEKLVKWIREIGE